MEVKMKAKELIEEFGGNGIIYADAGQGCGEPCFIFCDDEDFGRYADIELYPIATAEDKAYAAGATLWVAPKVKPSHISDWVKDGDGYYYRIIY